MIVASRLSAVWQVAGVAAAALCCYLVSQSVASERGALTKVDRQIAEAHDQIASLQMEIGVRARMGQLESWNRQVLALQAPRPAQFVASGIQLASLYGRKGQPNLPLDPTIVPQQDGPVLASYQPPAAKPAPSVPVVAAAPAPMPSVPVDPQPVLRTAAYVRPMGTALGAQAALPVRKTSFETVPPSRPVEAQPKAKPVPHADRPVRLAARDGKADSLLPADIGQLAAREAHDARNDGKAAR